MISAILSQDPSGMSVLVPYHFFLIQHPRKTNDPEGICEHHSQLIAFFFLGDMIICAWCCRMWWETQTSKWNETCHESVQQTALVFIRSLGDEEHMDLVGRLVAECRQKDTEYEWS